MSLRSRRKKWWNTTRDVSVTALEVVKDSADAFPPLKSVAGFLTATHNVTERIASIPRRTEALQFRLANIDQRIQCVFPQSVELPKDLSKRLESCIFGLVEIAQELQSLQNRNNRFKKLTNLRRLEGKLCHLSDKIDQAELEVHDIYTLCGQNTSKMLQVDMDDGEGWAGWALHKVDVSVKKC
ncbi:hypothetical protein DL96DRAFT_1558418 [Flagelloscypha sp. PMI_526]|nr:hypothetical protein DL96DRAFT_1558418 [Flagelloscypha sp. PMI_526]